MAIPKDLREFIECLNSNKVEFLVVGALAVAFHGFPRYSGDIDFLVRPSPENADRILAALKQFGFGGLGISASDLSEPGKVVQLGFPPNRIDLMTSLTAVSFDEAWAGRLAGEVGGLAVQFIGRDALLRNKEGTGRPKDRIDAQELRKMDRRK